LFWNQEVEDTDESELPEAPAFGQNGFVSASGEQVAAEAVEEEDGRVGAFVAHQEVDEPDHRLLDLKTHAP
jgi:hypothetical protein